ncbi:MAG TPA: cytochrome c3 family protein [Kofleriaceae bacterium]|nr:cytochrome c3 family protein [Kofleriaceae bacterium]
MTMTIAARRWLLAIVAMLAVAACARVLGFKPSGPQPFPHRKHVLAGIACTQCHRDLATDDGTRLHVPDDASCVARCHTKPHDPNPCSGCHGGTATFEALAEARQYLVFDHGRHLPRVSGNCMRCHVRVAEGDTNLRAPMATCFRCHDHDAERDARNCNACHKNLERSGELPASHLAHDGDWLREHGTRAASSADLCQSCHGERFCASCHGVTVAALPSTTNFVNPFAASVHRAGFSARHALEAKSDPGACQTCHQPDRCLACHTARGVAGAKQRSPHPPGWIGLSSEGSPHGREARRDPAACAGCHGGAGEMLCVSCHKVGGIGGNPHPPGWSSRLPLGAMPCRLCHPLGAAR